MHNSFEELCIMWAAAENSFTRVLNPHGGTYIYIYIYSGGATIYISIFFSCKAAVASILLYGCTTWTLTKRLEKKLDGSYTRMLLAILNKSWWQHPTKHQLYSHLPPITKIIQVRRTRHAGHCWRSRDELISDVLLWTPTYGRAKPGRPARTYIQQLWEDTGCCPENLPEAMNDREKWRERMIVQVNLSIVGTFFYKYLNCGVWHTYTHLGPVSLIIVPIIQFVTDISYNMQTWHAQLTSDQMVSITGNHGKWWPITCRLVSLSDWTFNKRCQGKMRFISSA